MYKHLYFYSLDIVDDYSKIPVVIFFWLLPWILPILFELHHIISNDNTSRVFRFFLVKINLSETCLSYLIFFKTLHTY
jgi:hypothetical protein